MQKLISNQPALLLLFLIAAGFAISSLFVAPLMDNFGPRDPGSVLVYLCFGAIGAAASTIAIVGVLPAWPFWFRVPLSFGLGTLLFGIWTVGFSTSMVIQGRGDFAEVARQWAVAVCCYPLVFLAVQSPLWLARTVGNWTISDTRESSDRRPLSIRDMLTGIALVGFAMAGAQFGRQIDASAFSSPSDFWIAIGSVALTCMAVSLLTIPPVTVAILRSTNILVGMTSFVVYAFACLTITLVVGSIVEGSIPQGWDLIAAAIVVSSFTAGATTPLLIARQLGYRLQWGRDRELQSTKSEMATEPA